jgi:uncharacterized protein (DUF362 family)
MSLIELIDSLGNEGEPCMSRNTNRREFLKTGLITTAALVTAGPAAIFSPTTCFAENAVQKTPDVVVSHGSNPGAITRAAVDALGGIKRFVKPGAKVVIKPNMSFESEPKRASNTDPDVVSEVAKMCAEAGASSILVLDNTLQQAHECLSRSKIAESCASVPNTSVHALKGHRLFKDVKVNSGKHIKSLNVASDVLNADVLIAVPVGKSHASTGVSLSMKGMMGLIFDSDRRKFHNRNLHGCIVDMVTVIKPHLVIIDGVRILSTHGPFGPGKVLPLNLVIASTDMVAADAEMVALGTWYGKKLQPSQVRHIRLAAERGLGRIDLDKLNIKNITV